MKAWPRPRRARILLQESGDEAIVNLEGERIWPQGARSAGATQEQGSKQPTCQADLEKRCESKKREKNSAHSKWYTHRVLCSV